jgi:hypothetical protein
MSNTDSREADKQAKQQGRPRPHDINRSNPEEFGKFYRQLFG